MYFKNHFHYNEETCEYIPVKKNSVKACIYASSQWILNGLVLACCGLVLLSGFIGTPSELALSEKNATLIQQMNTVEESITVIEARMEHLAELDSRLYRSVLGLDPLTFDERIAGIGGSDPYQLFEVHSDVASAVLRSTAAKIDNLERQMGIQKTSFEDIKEYHHFNQEQLRHLPAIKPVNGIILSGYGMRNHPVLNQRRVHHGADFRAIVGTPIYATGDGTVKRASRWGSYGLLVIIDHGHGYETRYAHLSSFKDGIRPGKTIKRGDQIGFSGSSGMTRGPHLHYEVRVNRKSVDPVKYMIPGTTPDEHNMYQQIAGPGLASTD